MLEHNRKTTLTSAAFHRGRRAQFLVQRRWYLKCIPPRTSGSSRVYVSGESEKIREGRVHRIEERGRTSARASQNYLSRMEHRPIVYFEKEI